MTRKYLLAGIVVVAIIVLSLAAAVFVAPPEPELPAVYIVYDHPKGDRSYADSAYRGLFAAQEVMAFNKQEFVGLNASQLSSLPDGGGPGRPGLIITIGYNYGPDTARLAREHPDIRFLGIDQAGAGAGNYRSYEITSYGASYLAGILAASVTKTRRVGIILGTQSELLDGFRFGYLAGIRALDPSVIVDIAYVRDNSTAGFNDPEEAARIAGRMYRNGTDVIFTVAGFSGTGAIAEAKKAPGRYIIGVDSDQTELGPSVILASAIKRLDLAVYANIEEFLNGTWSGGSSVTGLREGVTGLVYNPKYASHETAVSRWQERAEAEEAAYLATRR